ncbi:MAG: class I SAM-dependent methyltransferase [bacterium]
MTQNNIENLNLFITEAQPDYELLDSGSNYKLERYGKFVLSRPDPQALWATDTKTWKSDAEFRSGDGERGNWNEVLESWPINFGGITLKIKLSPFKHTGLFPEQLANWQWMEKLISESKRPIKVLNLFGYTGGATLVCAKAGAEVTHVDASKSAITWANENAELSGLKDKPIRWMLDDALAFVKKEIRRGNKYDAIVMDPPAYGRGAKGEVWKIEEGFLPLIDDCINLLSDNPLFFVLNGYSAGYSAIAYAQNITVIQQKYGGTVESGELVIQESKHKRLLPCGIVARWKI